METLPAGFSYVDGSAAVTSSAPRAGIGAAVSGQTVTFSLVAVDSFTYKVAVGSEVGDGQHTFSGVLEKLSGDEPIGGDDNVAVEVGATTPPTATPPAPPDTGTPGPRGPAGPEGEYRTCRTQGEYRTCRARGRYRTCRVRGRYRTCRVRGRYRTCRARGRYRTCRARGRYRTCRVRGRYRTCRARGRYRTCRFHRLGDREFDPLPRSRPGRRGSLANETARLSNPKGVSENWGVPGTMSSAPFLLEVPGSAPGNRISSQT